jgi:hypothetical protein
MFGCTAASNLLPGSGKTGGGYIAADTFKQAVHYTVIFTYPPSQTFFFTMKGAQRMLL